MGRRRPENKGAGEKMQGAESPTRVTDVAEMLHAETRERIGQYHEETRAALGSFAMDVVEGLGAMLESRGSSIDAGYLVEIGVARLEVIEVDGALRRGEDVDVRRTLGRVDDLFRRIECAIVRNASPLEEVV